MIATKNKVPKLRKLIFLLIKAFAKVRFAILVKMFSERCQFWMIHYLYNICIYVIILVEKSAGIIIVQI